MASQVARRTVAFVALAEAMLQHAEASGHKPTDQHAQHVRDLAHVAQAHSEQCEAEADVVLRKLEAAELRLAVLEVQLQTNLAQDLHLLEPRIAKLEALAGINKVGGIVSETPHPAFVLLEPERPAVLDDAAAQARGFSGVQEVNHLIAHSQINTAEKFETFKKWTAEKGTKEQLLALFPEATENAAQAAAAQPPPGRAAGP